jgi:putative hemolysin
MTLMRVLACVLTGLCLLPLLASAIMNPAAVYCNELNYTYTVETTDAGQIGYCVLANNQPVDAWQFLQGTSGQSYSYCALNGYPIKTIDDPSRCSSIYSESCAVCILPDGNEVEVTTLMNLSFREPDLDIGSPVCGSGMCAGDVPDKETSAGSNPGAALSDLVALAAVAAGAAVFIAGYRKR